ncbi:MAG: DUF2264 domain-containing protein [Desulfobacteraceae bacterium]|nr:DUF2264 domain-containing protein [Desulfobacteraceae bacterium]
MRVTAFKGKCDDMRHGRVAVTGVDDSRSSWEHLFHTLQRASFRHISTDKAYIFVNRHVLSENGRMSDGLEGFARTFLGLSFYLYNKQNEDVPEEVENWVEAYIEGISNGSNPNHTNFWGHIESPQLLVECASISLGLLIARISVWKRLDANTRSNFILLLRANCKKKFWENNWLWFRILHHLALEELAGDNHSYDILNDLNLIGQMYRGDGWYHDGTLTDGYRHIDYYNAYAMHFYGLLFAWIQGGRYEDAADELKNRAKAFFKDYDRLFSPMTHPPIFGRSMIYRFASVSAWAPGLLTGCCSVQQSRVKRWMTDTVNAYLENGCAEKSGRLGFGVYGEQLHIKENYSGGGSPYWAFKAFAVLLLPETDLFWQISADTNENESGIYSIASGDLCVIQTACSHILTINPNMTHKWYAMNYNKFAYSNFFLPNLEMMFPVDNMLLLQRPGTKLWSHRSQIIDSASEKKELQFTWRAHPDSTIFVQTTLQPISNGYLAEHILLSGECLNFVAGGFAIPKLSLPRITRLEDSVVIHSKNGISAVMSPNGKRVDYDVHKSCQGVGNTNTFVPCIRGRFDNNRLKKLTIAVIAAKNQDMFANTVSEVRRQWNQQDADDHLIA